MCTVHISSDSSILIVRYNSKGVVDGWSLLLLLYYSGLVKLLCRGCLAKNECVWCQLVRVDGVDTSDFVIVLMCIMFGNLL